MLSYVHLSRCCYKGSIDDGPICSSMLIIYWLNAHSKSQKILGHFCYFCPSWLFRNCSWATFLINLLELGTTRIRFSIIICWYVLEWFLMNVLIWSQILTGGLVGSFFGWASQFETGCLGFKKGLPRHHWHHVRPRMFSCPAILEASQNTRIHPCPRDFPPCACSMLANWGFKGPEIMKLRLSFGLFEPLDLGLY